MERHELNSGIHTTTANEMVAYGKGLLAIDESNGTCSKRVAQRRRLNRQRLSSNRTTCYC